ncbi:MAG: hypothetical protein ACOX0K_09410 [Oscillospiraceae bacterium]
MMLKFVDHIDMLVTDLEAQITFFEKLGFIIKRRLPDHGNAVEMQLPARIKLYSRCAHVVTRNLVSATLHSG